jgi:hypothetical protein
MKKILITLVAVLALAVSAQAITPEQAAAAKQILAKNGNAVIEISTILKIEFPGESARDQKLEILGTVIDGSGLAIVSNSAIDPLSMMQGQFPAGMEPKIKYSDVKYRLADGKEVPARVVLKDADLDLAFLAPTLKEGETAPKFESVVALDAKAEAAILDNIVNLTRLPKSLDRQASVELGYVSAVIQKPRRFYSYETIGGGQIGIPVSPPTARRWAFACFARNRLRKPVRAVRRCPRWLCRRATFSKSSRRPRPKRRKPPRPSRKKKPNPKPNRKKRLRRGPPLQQRTR